MSVMHSNADTSHKKKKEGEKKKRKNTLKSCFTAEEQLPQYGSILTKSVSVETHSFLMHPEFGIWLSEIINAHSWRAIGIIDFLYRIQSLYVNLGSAR